MPRRFGVTIDCARPAALAAFWVEVLGYKLGDGPPADGPEEERDAWASIRPADGDSPAVYFQRVPEGKTAKNRMHLDVVVGGAGTLDERRARIDAEVARLKALGASDHRGSSLEGGTYWIRMNDPEGNEFCLV